MIVRRLDDRKPIETPGGNRTSGLATPSVGAAEVSVIHQRMAAGGQNPLHRHDREEVMVLAAGTVTVTCANEPVALAAGDTLIIPANTLHTIANMGGEPAEWLIIAPAGVRFFSEAGEEMHPAWAQ